MGFLIDREISVKGEVRGVEIPDMIALQSLMASWYGDGFRSMLIYHDRLADGAKQATDYEASAGTSTTTAYEVDFCTKSKLSPDGIFQRFS